MAQHVPTQWRGNGPLVALRRLAQQFQTPGSVRTTIGGREFPASLLPCGRIPLLARLKEPEIISSGLSNAMVELREFGPAIV